MASWQQMTNEQDGEVLRVSRRDDGSLCIESCPCDGDGYPFAWASFAEVAVRHADGAIDAEQSPDAWTDSRTAVINDLLKLI